MFIVDLILLSVGVWLFDCGFVIAYLASLVGCIVFRLMFYCGSLLGLVWFTVFGCIFRLWILFGCWCSLIVVYLIFVAWIVGCLWFVCGFSLILWFALGCVLLVAYGVLVLLLRLCLCLGDCDVVSGYG